MYLAKSPLYIENPSILKLAPVARIRNLTLGFFLNYVSSIGMSISEAPTEIYSEICTFFQKTSEYVM